MSGDTALGPSLRSRIEAVTVYRCGARITRVAELSKNGAYPPQVTVGDLPLSLDDASVRVRVESVDRNMAPPVANRVGRAKSASSVPR